MERYLKLFTFVPIVDIADLITEHNEDPGRRKAQHTLAWEVLSLVHGSEIADKTQREHQMMRNPSLLLGNSKFSPEGGEEEAPSPQPEERSIVLPKSEVLDKPYSQILHSAGLADSKSQGVRTVSSGGVYVASRSDGQIEFTQVKDRSDSVREETLIDGRLLLRLGKWKVRVIEIMDDEVFNASGEGCMRDE